MIIVNEEMKRSSCVALAALEKQHLARPSYTTRGVLLHYLSPRVNFRLSAVYATALSTT